MKSSNKTTKRLSIAIAGMLVAMFTFVGELSSHGETAAEFNNSFELNEQAILERAIEDVESSHYVPFEEPQLHIIKIYDEAHNLLDTIELEEGQDEIGSQNAKSLLNKAEFLSKYNNTSIYIVH